MRLAICLPCRDQVYASFAYDLAVMTAHFCGSTKGNEMILLTSLGTLVGDQREGLAEEAIQSGATHILWLDTDMRFPKDLPIRLAKHNKPIVACNYPTRKAPIATVAFDWADSKRDRILTKADSTGLEKCAAVGMGAMLVDTEVFSKIDRPWHFIPYNPKTQRMVGEDIWFCQRAREAGYDVWIDHDTSKHIAHIGTIEYTHDMVDPRAEFLDYGAPEDEAEDAA